MTVVECASVWSTGSTAGHEDDSIVHPDARPVGEVQQVHRWSQTVADEHLRLRFLHLGGMAVPLDCSC